MTDDNRNTSCLGKTPRYLRKRLALFFSVFLLVGLYAAIMGIGTRSEAHNLSEGLNQHTVFSQESRQAVQRDGEEIYLKQCASCHQPDGQGVSGIFPPLSGTDWVTGDKGRLIRIILHGMSEPIEVNGATYSGGMPPWKSILTDKEVAEVATYLRRSWGNEASAISEVEARRVRKATQGRTQAWTAELLKEEKHSGIPEKNSDVSTNEQASPDKRVTEEEQKESNLTSSYPFKKIVLVQNTTRPNVLDVAPDGRVFFAEREGAVRVWDPQTASTLMVGFIPVNAVHTSGLLGLVLDPNFGTNGWIYLYFSPLSNNTVNELARYTIVNNKLQPSSKRVILEVPTKRNIEQAHSAGDLTFGPDGNLFLSTGDHANPTEVQLYSPIDERPGRSDWDAQRTSANTNSLEGKILRIHPKRDGSYTIPEGNLFPQGSQGREEIYVMGNRNPYRISVDSKTGWLYWGDVGPGAPAKSDKRGPKGYDEFNQAREAGNYGWPYFVADNRAYRKFDFATKKAGPYYDPEAPVNDSPNNTGARVLPPARPAMIWYSKERSERFPEMGAGGAVPMAGPVYHYDVKTAGPHALPASFDGHLFIFEFMRNWIQTVTFDNEGDIAMITPFLPDMTFNRPMDMEVGPEGALYVIEWGTSYEGWYNDDAQIIRLEFQGTTPTSIDSSAESLSTKESSLENREALDMDIAWPVEGGIFNFNEDIPYRITFPETKSSENKKEFIVQPLLGHDTHTHPLQQHTGDEGMFQIHPDRSHMYLEDEFAVLKACYTDKNNSGADFIAGCTRTVLQPRRKEAEHAKRVHGAEREIIGSLRERRNVQVLHVLEDGDHLSYAPINLLNIESITFRVAPAAAGTIEIRLDEPEGDVLARARVEAPSSIESSQEFAGEKGDDNPEGAQNRWTDVTVPVEDPGGVHELFLVFRGEQDTTLMKLDWFEFNGNGIMKSEMKNR